MLSYREFISEGVHAEFRSLTNKKVVDAVDLILKHLGIDLHYCKFSSMFSNMGKIDLVPGMITGSDISLFVENGLTDVPNIKERKNDFVVYLFVNIGDIKYYRIFPNGDVQGMDNLLNLSEMIKGLKGYLFTLETYGLESRNSAILRDKKSLNKDSVPKDFTTDYDLADYLDVNKICNQLITKIQNLKSEELIAKLQEIINDNSKANKGACDYLESCQKKLMKLCCQLDDCKQIFKTAKNLR